MLSRWGDPLKDRDWYWYLLLFNKTCFKGWKWWLVIIFFFFNLTVSPFHKTGTFWFLQPNTNKETRKIESRWELRSPFSTSEWLWSLLSFSSPRRWLLPSPELIGESWKVISCSDGAVSEHAMTACELNFKTLHVLFQEKTNIFLANTFTYLFRNSLC